MKPRMLYREFTRAGKVWTLTLSSQQGGSCGAWDENEQRHDVTDMHEQYRVFLGDKVLSDSEFDKHLRRVFERMESDGWAETQRSLSRRTFRLEDERTKKFWAISLVGAKHVIQFGRMPHNHSHWNERYGQCAEKEFASAERALDAYHKLITKKLAEDYVEIDKRKSAYTTPPRRTKGK